MVNTLASDGRVLRWLEEMVVRTNGHYAKNIKNTLRMGRLYKPWSYVGASITESELSDFISNILPHFMVAYSQSNELPLKDRPCASHLKNPSWKG